LEFPEHSHRFVILRSAATKDPQLPFGPFPARWRRFVLVASPSFLAKQKKHLQILHYVRDDKHRTQRDLKCDCPERAGKLASGRAGSLLTPSQTGATVSARSGAFADYPMSDAEPRKHRLFVGIPIPENVAAELAGLSRTGRLESPAIRWTDPAKLHITLKFLGMAPAAAIGQIGGLLGQIRFPRFELVLDGADLFENVGVIVAKLQPSASLLALQRLVEKAAHAVGFAPDQRLYKAHISLARIKRISGHVEQAALQGKTMQQLDSLCKALPTRRFAVKTLILYESIDGRYLRLKQFELE
jgi:2'-5' RNA ligase